MGSRETAFSEEIFLCEKKIEKYLFVSKKLNTKLKFLDIY
jgi:hypothetical protein